jgi:transcriptional regulator with XRE-family HTH domain
MGKRQPRTTREVLANNLAALDERHGTQSQRVLAERAGVGQGTIQRARTGDANVTVDNLDRIAHAYHVPVWQLLKSNGVPEGLGLIQAVQIEPTRRVNATMELPQSAIDVAVAWMALPERERNEFKRMLMKAAAPYRDPQSVGDGQTGAPSRRKAAKQSRDE